MTGGRKRVTRRGAGLALVLSSLLGCGSSYLLNGADPAEGAPADVRATYTAASCVLADGSPTPGTTATYYLTDEGGPVLYEIDPEGTGARITNQWTDERGMHFFAWKGSGPAYHFFFPAEGTPPIRYVLTAGTYDLDRSTPGVTKPMASPTVTCVMEPSER